MFRPQRSPVRAHYNPLVTWRAESGEPPQHAAPSQRHTLTRLIPLFNADSAASPDRGLQPPSPAADNPLMLFIAAGTLLIALSLALLVWSLPRVPTSGQ
jgi:hypothetical protein